MTHDFRSLAELRESIVDTARLWQQEEHCYIFKASYARAFTRPREVNCITFVKAVFASHNFWLPRSLKGLLYRGVRVTREDEYQPGDLVFRQGVGYNFTDTDRAQDGVGHVGIFTGSGVIHAQPRKRLKDSKDIIEHTFSRFHRHNGRGVYRVLFTPSEFHERGVPVHLNGEFNSRVFQRMR